MDVENKCDESKHPAPVQQGKTLL